MSRRCKPGEARLSGLLIPERLSLLLGNGMNHITFDYVVNTPQTQFGRVTPRIVLREVMSSDDLVNSSKSEYYYAFLSGLLDCSGGNTTMYRIVVPLNSFVFPKWTGGSDDGILNSSLITEVQVHFSIDGGEGDASIGSYSVGSVTLKNFRAIALPADGCANYEETDACLSVTGNNEGEMRYVHAS